MAKNDVRSSIGGRSDKGDTGEFGEIVELVKTYAKQETVGPLRAAGRYLAYGLSGAFLMALGLILLLIGLLRVLQTETDVFDDGWSFVPYFIVVIVGAAIAALFLSRIPKDTLDA